MKKHYREQRSAKQRKRNRTNKESLAIFVAYWDRLRKGTKTRIQKLHAQARERFNLIKLQREHAKDTVVAPAQEDSVTN